jgi:hypothetical protein
MPSHNRPFSNIAALVAPLRGCCRVPCPPWEVKLPLIVPRALLNVPVKTIEVQQLVGWASVKVAGRAQRGASAFPVSRHGSDSFRQLGSRPSSRPSTRTGPALPVRDPCRAKRAITTGINRYNSARLPRSASSPSWNGRSNYLSSARNRSGNRPACQVGRGSSLVRCRT